MLACDRGFLTAAAPSCCLPRSGPSSWLPVRHRLQLLMILLTAGPWWWGCTNRCADDEVEEAGSCQQRCNAAEDCARGETCEAGRCVPATSTASSSGGSSSGAASSAGVSLPSSQTFSSSLRGSSTGSSSSDGSSATSIQATSSSATSASSSGAGSSAGSSVASSLGGTSSAMSGTGTSSSAGSSSSGASSGLQPPAHLEGVPLPVGLLDVACSGDSNVDTGASSPTLCGVAVPTVAVDVPGTQGMLVFVMRSLVVQVGTVRFLGPRAPVLVVEEDAVIQGTLDVGARTLAPGPGVSLQAGCTGAVGHSSNSEGGGGGGGGNATAGGEGGRVFPSAVIAGGAPVTGDLLEGGCAGGQGGKDQQNAGPLAQGGQGGGAIQLSVRGTLALAGVILADGAGGGAGDTTADGGGGGGGSGGLVVLEAQMLDLQGVINVTGGGGGTEGLQGASGRTGGAGAAGTYPGGAGGTPLAAPTPGLGQQDANVGAGAGGGAAGRVLELLWR